ncbi:MAG: TrmH family RNA methyltransferase [Anaerovoracaceae bacterium]
MIKVIQSKDNRIFKACQKLQQKKYRDREGLYLIEGPNLIGEAPAADIEYIVISEERQSDYGEYLSGEQPVYLMAEQLFRRIAQTETSQGIAAAVKRRSWSWEQLSKLCGPGKNLVVLDRLQDPGNIGTIIRTAEGAGYSAVVAVKGTADIFSPKTIRAAAGTVFRIPIVQVGDNRELKALTDRLGKRLVVTSLFSDNYYFDTDISADTALVIGNEGSGVSEELAEMAHIRIKIPMEGRLESLNASVAAGILMYEMQRCRRAGKSSK